MAERVRIEHVFECPQETFWSTFLDEKYNRALFLDFLKFDRWEVLEVRDSEERLERRIAVEPRVGDLPAPIKKVIGETIGYKEDGYLDKKAQRYHVKVLPTLMTEKFSIVADQWTEPLDGGKRCRRIFDGTIAVRIFGVGGLIEKRIAADLRRSYDIGADFTNRYIRENGLA